MINDETNNYYYYALKNLSELNSLGWLQSKKEAIINNNTDNNNSNNNNNDNNNFQNALDDALNYQTIESHPERISKLNPYINKYNWKGIEFPESSKEWQNFEQNNKTITLNILHVNHNAKKISIYSKQPWEILDRKKARHGPSDWAMLTRCSFDKNK